METPPPNGSERLLALDGAARCGITPDGFVVAAVAQRDVQKESSPR
jgi:hypothetical protein